MPKHLISLCLICLLLCSCADPTVPEEAAPIQEPAAEPVILYDAGSQLQQNTRGAVQTYRLNAPDCTGLRNMGESVLLFSGKDTTTLTLLNGEPLQAAACAELGMYLSPDDRSVSIGTAGLSYFDPGSMETLVLDAQLKEQMRIPAPDMLLGIPILSADGKTLYYCTADAVHALELESGIHRSIRETSVPFQSIWGLHQDERILACLKRDGTIAYLSAENGQLLADSQDIQLRTHHDRYYAAFPTGMTQALLFGAGEDPPQALTPAELSSECFFLEAANAAVTVFETADAQVCFDYYSLSSGLRAASLTLSSQKEPISVTWAKDMVYILVHDRAAGQDTLFRWDIHQARQNDETVYTGPYYTREHPDLDGLARCQQLAEEIGQTCGVRIRVWEDAAAAAPWDYALEPEYLVPVTEQALELLRQQLSQFPAGMLEAAAANFDSLTICLVRSITGSADSTAGEAVSGLQYFLGNHAYVAITAGQSAGTLYHELYHVMETRILNQSIALDQWDSLNPKGFSYDLDYRKNLTRDGSQYLLEETRAFIDTYSMSFPREDRARILEYACTTGKEAWFRSEPMQAKLRTLCQGIREAYGLEEVQERFLWEQYLYVPMA